MICLLDVNNMYCSVERSFNPSLVGKPVIVLSNNDGAVVARSNESKRLGIKMSVPFFEIKELVETHDVQVFSANYPLIGETSARLMSLLGRFIDPKDIEINSVDEAFLDFTAYGSVYPDLEKLARHIRAKVDQWLRLPVSLGVAPTKTLAKVANFYAKRQDTARGVVVLATEQQIWEALTNLPVGELWGVGSRYETKLKRAGITTAWQLRNAPDDWIADLMTVNGLRLAYELRGQPCKLLEAEQPPRKAI